MDMDAYLSKFLQLLLEHIDFFGLGIDLKTWILTFFLESEYLKK